MKGWVYVITNKAMPGLVKVGYSMKDPALRAEELDHTGSPHPYIVDYEVLVEEPFNIEQKVHSHLKNHREGKEWFRCTSEEAIAAIQTIIGNGTLIENFKRADRERAIAIRQQQEAGEQARKVAEEEQQKHKTEIEQQRKEIIAKYGAALDDVLAKTNFLSMDSIIDPALPETLKSILNFIFIYFCIFLGVLGVLIVIALMVGTEHLPDSAFIISIVLSLFITLFGKSYFAERAKKSPQYKALIAERDRKIAALENTGPQPEHTIIICPKCSQKLKVPSGRHLEVTCTICRHQFTMVT